MKKHSFPLFMTMLVCFSCATQQERAERRELMKKAVTEAVATKRMHIDITSMSTLRYGSRMVAPDFYLELLGDSIRSYLPYMGQAYQAPIASPSQGLNFDAHIQSLRESHPKKDLSRLEIGVKTTEDTYLYTIELYDSGKAFIHVQSMHRDPISFDGDLVPQEGAPNARSK